MYKHKYDGTPCEVKVSCTVWVGGKSGDDIKGLPIDIKMDQSYYRYCCFNSWSYCVRGNY
ncbi:MAG: hypothetical protein CVV02_01615 [Firmicutes bacterium HGW-Firmicutes-7]|nr:MAG: hypothetical protein CVV02_01615 [Firmicutes bacterium HGW-Firmicutes-7]